MRSLLFLGLFLTGPAFADVLDGDDQILIALDGGACENHCPMPAIPCPPPCK